MNTKTLPSFICCTKKIHPVVVSLCLLFFSSSARAQMPLSGSYTINQNVASGGTNFNSFKDFSDSLTANGVSGNVTATVVAGSGPYTEQVKFQNISGIGSGAQVTIEGNGEIITSDTAILSAGPNPNRHIIKLIGLQYFTINNLHVNMVTGSTAFIGIHTLTSGNHITISNCKVDMGTGTSTLLGAFVFNNEPTSIITTGGVFDNIQVINDTVTGGGYGVSVFGLASPNLATNVVIDNNYFFNFNSNGVYLRESDGAQVSNNHFDKAAGSTSSTNAIQLAQALNVNGRVFGNYIKMSQTTGSLVGIYLFNGTGHKVYNNVISDIHSTTGTIEGIRVRTGGTAPEIYFNTISFDNPNPTTGNLRGFREELSNTNSILRNNIFNITQTTSGTKSAIELGSISSLTTAINSNYNVFWVPGGNVGMKSTTAYPTLTSWQTATTQDANSFETDPIFQSGTAIPQSGVINGQGITIAGITTDILGVTRSNPPDPGAYEFSPPSSDAAITDFILPPIPHCANTLDVQFELTNAGGDPLNSVTINWTVNGVSQPVVNWSGPPLASGASTIVTLGTVPVTGLNTYDFTATSSNPNGNPDANPGNDSYTYTGFRRGLEGAFTINAAAPVSSTNYQNFQSIADILSQYGVCMPITITVMNGPYNEQVVFHSIPGTNSVNTVTLDGNGQTLNYNPIDANNDHILQLNGVNYMMVKNLTVISLHPTQGRGIHITNGASKIIIMNNNVVVSMTNNTSSSFGIIISGANWLLDGSLSDSVVITGNTVSGGYSGIQLSGVHWTQPLTRIVVSNNTILDWYGFGVYLSYTNNAIVSKNTIRRPNRTNSGSDAVTPAGITVPAGSLGFLLEKNKIYDLHLSMPQSPTISRGFYISGTTTAPTSGSIQNNLVYGMNNDGAQYGIQNNSVTGPVNIYHNTIVLNNATAASTSNTDAIRLSNFSAQSGIDIRNNIFYVTRGGSGTKRIFEIETGTTSFVSNYNAVWFNPTGGTQTFGTIGSTNYATFNDWQTQTGKDANSVHADPLFTNPGTGDFKPTNVAIDGTTMGTSSVGVPDDIFDVVRSSNPDPGAIEFVPPLCTGANGGTANTTAGPFCGTGSGTITATGYSTGPGISYQWQYSNDNFAADVHDLAGETNPASASTGTITSTTYYRLKVTCSSGPTVAYSNIVVITINQDVSITTNPSSQTVCSGSNVTFTVVAGGTNLTYQWRKGGADISGATSNSYTITGVTTGDAGNYDVVITGTCGTAISNVASLSVTATGTWIGVTSTNWNTPSNWCGGIPTPSSDIIIPATAPNMPNLSSGSGTARNITINTGASLTVGTGGILDIYGDVVNNGTFNASAGNLGFRGTASQSIPAFTTINATMNGTGGVILNGSATVTGNLTLTNGNITLGANNLSLATSSSGSVASHIITNGAGNVIVLAFAASSSRVIPVGINASTYNPVTLTANASHTTDDFIINVKQGVYVNGVSGALYADNVVDRTWTINEATPGGSNVNITLQWTSAEELTSFQRNRSFIMRFNGTAWINGPATGAGGTDPYSQTLNGVTSFSPFAVRTEPIPRPRTGIYPNPTYDVLNVVLDLPADTPITFAIYDAKGSKVFQQTSNVPGGLSRTTLNIEKLSSGVYVIKVATSTNPELNVQRFVKTLQ